MSRPSPTVAAWRSPGRRARARAQRIVRALDRAYPDARTALALRRRPFELLVATILSAQCTDAEGEPGHAASSSARFGTPARARRPRTPRSVEALVPPTGFFRQKAKSIQAAARDLAERFGGAVPETLEELVTLRGVARKTANVVLGNAFGIPGLAVDTHMIAREPAPRASPSTRTR